MVTETGAVIAQLGHRFDEATHVAHLDGVEIPTVTQILSACGLREDFSRVDPRVLEARRSLGEAVHRATHYEDEGTLDESTVADAVRPYLNAWRQFKEIRRVKLLALEERLVHPVLRYSGQNDRRAEVDEGRTAILDLKIGDPKSAGARWQLAAYSELATVATGGWRARERWAVQLHPERAIPYSVHPYRDPRDWRIFRIALELTYAKHELLGKHWRLT